MQRFFPSLNRRQFAISLLLAVTGRARAEESRKLAMRVKSEPFRAGEADIKAVVGSASGELWRHCPNTRFEPPGFEIYRNEKYPITHFERTEDGWIVVGLAAQETYWAQYAYQFAHEFCHALADHSNDWRRLWHNTGHANKWLEESLCETASLFALRAMGKSWQSSPPYPNWKAYAEALTKYAQDRLDDPRNRLPEGKNFADWFRENEPLMRKTGTIREKNNVVAGQLLPLLELEPRAWESVTSINLCKREPQKPLAQHLAEWRANTRDELKPFVSKLADMFEVRL